MITPLFFFVFVHVSHHFGQATITHLAVAKDLFDLPGRVLHLGPDTGHEFFAFQFVRVQLFLSAGALDNEQRPVFTIFVLIPLLNTKVTGITE